MVIAQKMQQSVDEKHVHFAAVGVRVASSLHLCPLERYVDLTKKVLVVEREGKHVSGSVSASVASVEFPDLVVRAKDYVDRLSL